MICNWMGNDLVAMKICIIGAFGFDTMPTGGQPVKTRNLYQLLSEKFGTDEVSYIETYGWKKHPFKMIHAVRRAVKQSENVIMLPAHNGVKVFSPLLLMCAKGTSVKLFYDVIGGWLPQKTEVDKKLSAQLRRFDGIWVETSSMKNALESQGFYNVSIVPNFKFITPLKSEELPPLKKPYRLCTFSRVMKEKGIEDAVDAVTRANNEMGETVYTLDIYGPVDENQIEWFNKLQTAFPQYVHYRGCVNSDKSVEVLKNYFALLFPTFYGGEGLAGTLIDAFSSGVPIIASDWKYNPEIVHEKVGIIYPTGNIKSFADILKTIADDPKIIIDKRQYCLQEAAKYSAAGVAETITEELIKS